MNYFSYITLTIIIQSLIFYDNYCCFSLEHVLYNVLSFASGVFLTYLIYAYNDVRKIEQLMQKFEDVL